MTAQATVNFRILPTQSVEGVINYVKSLINDDRVKITQGIMIIL